MKKPQLLTLTNITQEHRHKENLKINEDRVIRRIGALIFHPGTSFSVEADDASGTPLDSENILRTTFLDGTLGTPKTNRFAKCHP